MIELVFVACMITHPDCLRGKDAELSVGGSRRDGLLAEAPPTLATWTVEHPGSDHLGRCQESRAPRGQA